MPLQRGIRKDLRPKLNKRVSVAVVNNVGTTISAPSGLQLHYDNLQI